MGSVLFFSPSLMRYDVTAIKIISSLSFIVQYLKSKYKMLVIRGDQVKCHSRKNDFKTSR